MDTQFTGDVFEWRGPAPFFWVRVPDDACDYLRAEADASYGWGAIPVRVRIGATEWETSVLPKDGGYVLPVKTAVREREHLGAGETVRVAVTVTPRGGRLLSGSDAPFVGDER